MLIIIRAILHSLFSVKLLAIPVFIAAEIRDRSIVYLLYLANKFIDEILLIILRLW